MTPIASSPATIGTPRYELAGVPSIDRPANCASVLRSSGWRVCRTCDVSPSPNRIDALSPWTPPSL